MNMDLNITTWGILAGLLFGLVVFFILTSKNKADKKREDLKASMKLIFMGIFFAGVVGAGSYIILLPQSTTSKTVIKFPSTGSDPIFSNFVQCTKNLYATPLDGLITSFLLGLIIFLIIILFQSIYVKRRIEKEIDRIKNEFISIASHQLRTPVSGLSWLAKALQINSDNLNVKQKKYVEDLSILAKRLRLLAEDLLNVSRIQLKTEVVTEKESADFIIFVEEFIKEMGPYAESKKHTIVFNKDISEPVMLEINKKSLYNVLQNLVSNAIEYSPEGTAVTISIEKNNDFIKTAISNKGPAILKDEQPRIFERFYRTESAKKIKKEGTGLGLYIIKMIIEEMGGRVGFESESGHDTMFWFSLPLKAI